MPPMPMSLRHRRPLRRPTSSGGRRSPVIGLVLLALLGLILAAVDWSHLAVSGAHIRTALGESFIVAAALGLTVDFFYKRELARDAFEASLGYLLPEELKAELRWIYGQQIICVEHDQHVVVKLLDDEESAAPRRVRVEFEVWRTMRNVSNQRVEHPTFSSVDEWFRGEDSEVGLIECVRGGRQLTGGALVTPDGAENGSRGRRDPHHGRLLAPSQLEPDRPGVERTLGAPVTLDPGEEATFHYHGHEIHYESGVLHQVFGAPTCRPAVRVEGPPGFRTEAWFASRGRSEATHMGGRFVLPGVLLPFQSIMIRWWPEEKDAEWRRRRLAQASEPGDAGAAPHPAAG
jgi:hypothetical protein